MRRHLSLRVACIIAASVAAAPSGHAHRAQPTAAMPQGWEYPHDCCHDQDCARVLEFSTSRRGTMVVTTKHGSAEVEPDTSFRPSKDEHFHGCIVKYGSPRLRCLFSPPGG